MRTCRIWVGLVAVLGLAVIVGAVPLIHGADPTCVTFAQKQACNYSPCQKTITTCSASSMDAALCAATKEVQVQINNFTCITSQTANKKCEPETKPGANGEPVAATTDCVITYNCKYDNTKTPPCQVDATMGSGCQAPYYKTVDCPP